MFGSDVTTTASIADDGGTVGSAALVLQRGAVVADRYEVLDALGAGGGGTVFVALDRQRGQRVALKVLHDDADPATQRRLRREVSAARAVSHPRVCRVLELVEIENDGHHHHVIVQDLVEGEDLRRWLSAHQPSRREAMAILLDLANALAAIHRAGLVHCDVKPENICISSSEGRVTATLVDFGVARPVDESAIGGTRSWMAPEQAGGVATPATDVYAFGLIASRLLSSRVPPAWRSVVTRCLAESPTTRWADGTQLARRLRARRARAPMMIAAIVLVALVGVLAILWLAGSGPARPSLDLPVVRGDAVRALVFGNGTKENVHAIRPDGEGGLFVAGHFSTTMEIGGVALRGTAGRSRSVVMRLDPAGRVRWASTVTAAATSPTDARLSAITITRRGDVVGAVRAEGVLVVGDHEVPLGRGSSALVAWRPDGTVRWAAALPDDAVAITALAAVDDDVLAAGMYGAEELLYAVRVTSDGHAQWTWKSPATGRLYAAAVVGVRGFVAGNISSRTARGVGVFVELDLATGGVLTETRDPSLANIYALSGDRRDGLLVGGNRWRSDSDRADAFVWRQTLDGSVTWDWSARAEGAAVARAVAVSATGIVWVALNLRGTDDLAGTRDPASVWDTILVALEGPAVRRTIRFTGPGSRMARDLVSDRDVVWVTGKYDGVLGLDAPTPRTNHAGFAIAVRATP